MRPLLLLKTIVLVLLMAPAAANAATVFDSGAAGSLGFALFPFWQ